MPIDGVSKPQHRCLGHNSEGYGLSWNPNIEGQLLSGSQDGRVCLWNTSEAGVDVQALSTRCTNGGSVEDVDWHRKHSYMFGAVGDDSKIVIWDTRESCTSRAVEVDHAHDGDVNCVSFNPENEFYLATGGADGVVALWDLRKMSASTHQFRGHSEGVYQVLWAPFSDSVLASSSSGILAYNIHAYIHTCR